MAPMIIEIPRPERFTYAQVQLHLAGKPWSGRWHIEAGEVVVCSAYGSGRCKAGRRKPDRVAKELMVQILRDYCGAE